MGYDSLAENTYLSQMPQNLSAQFVCTSPKVLDFNEKRLHWASVVRDAMNQLPGQSGSSNHPPCKHLTSISSSPLLGTLSSSVHSKVTVSSTSMVSAVSAVKNVPLTRVVFIISSWVQGIGTHFNVVGVNVPLSRHSDIMLRLA